ncbi:MAG TPA: DUF2721 domain-containing protein [Candidatus Baltobacteraceae bacterium]|jgi:hypothetical protein
MNPFSASGISIISAMITPAILLLASGNLVSSTLTRIARVFDRAREIIDRARAARAADDALAAELLEGLLRSYLRRTSLLERALSAYYLAIGLFVAASLAIAFDNIIGHIVPWLSIAFVVAGAILLLLGSLAIFLETNLAAGILRHEIAIGAPGAAEKLR